MFFKNASFMTKEDVDKSITTPAVLTAFERAKLSTLPADVHKRYDVEKNQYVQDSIHTKNQVDRGKMEGKAEGKAEGQAEEKARIALEMHVAGHSAKDILALTKLKYSDLANLIKTMKCFVSLD
jgi:hypothetical protein